MKSPFADVGAITTATLAAGAAVDILPIVHEREAFSSATGLSFSLTLKGDDLGDGVCNGAFCRCLAATAYGCRLCLRTRQMLERRVAANTMPVETACFSGLVHMAVPVTSHGELLATLWVNPFLREQPTPERFVAAVQAVRRELSRPQESEARAAFFRLPIVSSKQQETIRELLASMASFLGTRISATAHLASRPEPQAIKEAREFVASHLDEPISLDAVARHVHLSRFYFCRLFRSHMGSTLKDYVNQRRIIKAAALLENPTLRIIEIAFAVGFGSVSHFDHVFHEAVGLSPKEYRGLRFAMRGPPQSRTT